MDVFLSASVPMPDRDQRFWDTADVIGIREAIKSLSVALPPQARLTFGGHPAITPLISLTLRRMAPDRVGDFILYQSEHFFELFPQENDKFIDVRVTHSVDNDRDASLSFMRHTMLTHCEFGRAIFIGGMEGVLKEFELLTELQPDVPCYPIASTGGAALDIFENGDFSNSLRDQLTYPTLFKEIFS